MTDGNVYRFGTGSVAYGQMLRYLRLHGREVSPRGMPVRELTDCMIVITHAEAAFPVNSRRLVNPKIAATEYTHLLGGISSLPQLDAASGGRFSQFANDGQLLGAYGPRTGKQFPRIAALLQKDPDTRQAVVSVWDTTTILEAGVSNDVPCTVSLQFRVRNGKLDMTVIMRSSDIWLGIPYDWFQFSRMQMTMAWALMVPAGSFTFFAGSLHLYERDAEAARKSEEGAITGSGLTPFITWPDADVSCDTSAMSRMSLAQVSARLIAFGHDHPGVDNAGGRDLAWFRERVPPIPEGHAICAECSYVSDLSEGKKCQVCHG